ncbi:MAG: glycoside hydrolase family 25 protein [Nitratireductor sp.]|nr:glycoside hydrolase family 25 protein [Nitratireductor sp.]
MPRIVAVRLAALLFAVAISLGACTSSPLESVLDVSVSNPRFGDSDPHEWEGRAPWQHAVHGIDVAKYQGSIDWREARRSGVSFAWIKATEGGDRVDDRFAENWRAAKAAGMPRGAYHFYYFCTPAFVQARWFIKNVPKEPGALPPVLDMEWNHLSPSCKFRPEPQAVRAEMTTYLKAVERHYGQKPVIYTTVDFFRENSLWLFKEHDFWLRSVAGHPDTVYPGHRWTFWQYTGTGRVPGISGDVDINAFKGTAQEWRKWATQNTR